MLIHSANLGFLWQEHDLIQGIRAAKNAGFAAVECHWPFDYKPQSVLDVLNETGLSMVGLNTYAGDKSEGDFGVCAHPDRTNEAHQVIDQAIEYAVQINTPNVHVMAGVPSVFKAMVASVLPTLTGGAPLVSRTLRMMKGEGDLAGPLRAFANAFPELSIGSYPFQQDGIYGCNIVARGSDPAALDTAMAALEAKLTA